MRGCSQSKPKRHRKRHRNRHRCYFTNLNKNEEATVVSAPDNPLLPSLGVRKGKKIKLKGRQWCGGPLIAEINGRNIALDRELSTGIEVEVKKQDNGKG